MSRFVITQPPEKTNTTTWVQRILLRLATWIDQPVAQIFRLEALPEEPAKPELGMMVLADGTNWNPGSGAGVYYYNGSSWTKL